jgi:hypothetical protein
VGRSGVKRRYVEVTVPKCCEKAADPTLHIRLRLSGRRAERDGKSVPLGRIG